MSSRGCAPSLLLEGLVDEESEQTTASQQHPASPSVVIVAGGFAGFHAARSLARVVRRRGSEAPRLDVMLVNPADYFLFLPLLPEAPRPYRTSPGRAR